MSEMITAYIDSMSTGFLIRQSVVTVLLFLLGYLTVTALKREKTDVYELLLSFPVGLSVYSVASFVLLVTGIPFNALSITLICSFIAFVCIVTLGRRSYWNDLSKKNIVVVIITLLCITVISTSGIVPVSVSNDSMYYYHMYPHALVHNGGLRMQFNVFLTDVGQTSAILNTLPFVYGFDESFGIQIFLVINTLLTVIYALYEQCSKEFDRKRSLIVSVFLAAILVCSMPYIIMSEWVMSNGYFMCFMFICVYTAWRNGRNDKEVMGLIFLMMSLLRMEGCIVALILVLCFSTLEYTGKQLFMIFLLPIILASVIYDIRIFLLMKIDAPYTFLTPLKAFIQLAAIAAVSVYVLLLRDRLSDKIKKHTGIAMIAALLLVNALLFMYNRTLYLENARAFIGNISNQSGWGLFPMLIIGIYAMCFIAMYKKTGYNTVYWDLCFASYMLTAIAVSFARGDALVENMADSGNRVMLQVTLLAFFAAAVKVITLSGSSVAADNDITEKITADQEEE